MATGYRLDGPEVDVRVPVTEKFLLSVLSRQVVGLTKPFIQMVPEDISLGEKWPGHEADSSAPTTAEVKTT
jgi:hypothetical protein